MTLRRSPKLYARPRAGGYPGCRARAHQSAGSPAPTASAPGLLQNLQARTGRVDSLWTICDFPVSQKLDFITFLRPRGEP